LPVQFRRRLSVDAIPTGKFAENYGGLGNWDIDIPYISGVFDSAYGWRSDRCSNQAPPDFTTFARPEDIWGGATVHIPGQGDKALLKLTASGVANGVQLPSGESFPWTTSDYDLLSCVPMHS